MQDVYIHPTAEVSPGAKVGAGTHVWHQAQVREGVRVGCDCIIGKGAYIDFGVQIGKRVKIQNYALIYHGATLEDGVFIGPRACLTNDKIPRAITPEGMLKGDDDWQVGYTTIRYGASIGAGAILMPGVSVGRFAMVGAGAIVTHDVPDYALVAGLPARVAGYVCACGRRLRMGTDGSGWCSTCQVSYDLGLDQHVRPGAR
jgi:acetyltransferase-like isoleucine patch superfamily enzyme